MVYGESPYKELSKGTHINNRKDVLNDMNITKSAVTHLDRYRVAVDSLENGESIADVAHIQRWKNKAISSAMGNYTLTARLTKTIVRQHGWKDMDHFECWRQGERADIPDELFDLVFPRLKEMQELAAENQRINSDKGIYRDLASVKFLEVLEYLAKVFLEDARIMIEQYPDFPAFKHTLFKTEAWKTWAAAEKDRVQEREDKYRIMKSNPEAGKVLESIQRDSLKLRLLLEKGPLLAAPAAPAAPAVPDPDPEPPAAPETKTKLKTLDPADVVPRIPDVASIKHAWYEWDRNLRDFFKRHVNKNIEWEATFQSKSEARSQINKMDRMKPFCLYMDYVIHTHPKLTAPIILERLKKAHLKLNDILGKNGTENDFVTKKMKNFIQRSKTIEPTGMAEALTSVGLPLPDKTSKEMRKELWG